MVGTPGRILDWVNKGQLDTSLLEHVVLDEVDQMLDMGFADDVDAIISHAYNRGNTIPLHYYNVQKCSSCTIISALKSPVKSFVTV